VRRCPAICSLVVLLTGASLGAGCGKGEVASGAVVSIYVAAPLCRQAQAELRAAGGRVGSVKVRAACLPETTRGGHDDLAAAGRNARRATEDSTAVAFIEAPGPAAKFTRSIVQSADIAWLEASSAGKAMQRVLAAVEHRGSASPRDAVRESL
jgi:hypothetical protein